jgi:sugar lactone lactonase YvrE
MSIVVLKSGDLLVADLEVHRIVKVPAAGGTPSVFAQVPAPRGLALDKEERLWVVSHGKDQLLRLTSEGKPEVVVTGRPFEFPSAVVVDDDLTAYVCDTYAKAIWKVPTGKAPEKLRAGDPLVSPVGLAKSGADLLVADPRAKAVIRVTAAGEATKVEFTVTDP